MSIKYSAWIIIKILLIISFMGFYSQELSAKEFYFDHIVSLDGKPIKNIRSIVKANDGYIWLGGDEGLLRFDGNEFIRVNKEPTSKIFIDHDNNFWSSGTGILTKISTDRFVSQYYPRLSSLSDLKEINTTYHMLITQQGRHLFATREGISEYNNRLDKFTHYQLVHQPLTADNVTGLNNVNNDIIAAKEILQLSDSELLIGTNQGLYIIPANFNQLNQIYLSNPLISEVDISKIVRTPNGGFLIGSNNGLYLLNKNFQIINHFACFQKTQCVNNNQVTDLLLDKDGLIWIGTGNGLYILDAGLKHIIELKHSSANQLSISNNLITGLLQDDLENIIVTTYSGIDYFNRQSLHLNENRLINNQQININNVWSIAKDKDDHLWLGTFGGGLHHLDATEHQVFSVDINNKNGLTSNRIPSLFNDSFGEFWVGTNTGLKSYLRETNEFINYPIENQSGVNFDKQGAITISEDSEQDLWIGSKNSFAKVFRNGDKPIIYNSQNVFGFKVDQWVRSIMPIDDIILIGTDLGLNIYNQKTNQNIHLNTPTYVIKIIKDSRGDIWVLAIEGLYLFNKANQSLLKMNSRPEDEILPEDIQTGCNGFVEDDFLQLWLVCHNGLEVFDLNQRQFIKRFDSKSGADLSGFLTGSNSIIKDSNGDILLATRGGFSRFKPFRQHALTFQSDTQITRVFYTFEGGNNDIEITPHNFIPLATKKINPILPYDLKSIHFRFSSLGSPVGNIIQFQYRLIGYENDWKNADKKNLNAVYNNLHSGDYRFEVRAKYPGSVWGSRSIDFSLASPPWLSWWAFIIYSFSVYLLVFLLVQFRTRQFIKNKLELEKVIRKRTKELAVSKENVELLMLEKEKIVENIYHQTKTPLQLMLSHINFLNKSELTIELFTQKQTAEIFKLSRLTEQALSISRSPSITDDIYDTVDILKLLKPLVLSYIDIAKTKNIKFDWQIEENIVTYCQPIKIENLLDNILSNAVKYTMKGFIKLEIKLVGNSFLISCQDSGIGISKEEKTDIFTRHSRASNTENIEGAGIGLAMLKQIVLQHNGSIDFISEINVGSTFNVSLPIIASPSIELETCLDNTIHLQQTEPSNDSKKPLILIVEDNIELALYLRKLLEANYQVINALSAEDGLQKTLEWIPDLVISDVMMGKMDGFQLCEIIRQNLISCHIPLLLLTAKSEPESRMKGFSSGANGFITKPFIESALLERIKNQLEFTDHIRQATINAHKIEINPVNDKLISRFLCFIEEHYQNSELLIKDICMALHVSVRQLERKVRYFIDMTPNEYLNEYRLLRARELLQTDTKIKHIYDACGFSSQAYFSRRYKQRFLITPSQESTNTTST